MKQKPKQPSLQKQMDALGRRIANLSASTVHRALSGKPTSMETLLAIAGAMGGTLALRPKQP